MSQRELILASTSAARRALLEALGLPFRCEAPDFDEFYPAGLPPADLAETLAMGKARSVAKRFPEALVLGADQVLVLDGRMPRKPETLQDARVQLRELNGRSHVLLSAFALFCEASHAIRVDHEITRLKMRQLSDDEIERYLATGEWKGCLGGFRIEGQGIKLFQRIEGDLFNVRGLPMVKLVNALKELGIALF